MQLIINNITTQAIISGRDSHLAGCNFEDALRHWLSVEVKGSYFAIKKAKEVNPKYNWDGVHYFMNKKKVFATGLVPLAINLADEHNVPVIIDDQRTNLPRFITGDFDFTTPDFDLYDHQKELITSTNNIIPVTGGELYFPRGIWKAATNSGKTAAFGNLIKNVENPCAILLVDSQELFEQHYEYYSYIFGEKNVGRIGAIKKGKYVYEIGKILTIAMVETLGSRLDKLDSVAFDLKHRFNILGVDECHGFAHATAVKVIGAIDAGMRVFMSGTPLYHDDPMVRMKLVAMSGKKLCEISKRFLMDNGFSLIPDITVYLNPDVSIGYNYRKEVEKCILTSVPRADMIADLLADRQYKKNLITFFEKRHGELMYTRFIKKYPQYKGTTDWVHGEDPRRAEKIAAYKRGSIKTLFTSIIMRQGINVKDIQHIVYAQGGQDPTGISQFMGRGERLDGVNTHFEFSGIYDRGEWISKHSRNLIKFYGLEKLEVKFAYPNRKGKPML